MTHARAAELDPKDFTPMVVILKLNGQNRGSVLMLRRTGDVFFFEEADLARWQVCHDPDSRVRFRQKLYYPIGIDSPTRQQYDPLQQTLEINLPPNCFERTNINLRRHATNLTPSSPGAFFNYEFFASGSNGSGSKQNNVSGLFEAVQFSRFGSFSTDAVAPNLTGSQTGQSSSDMAPLVRLDSAFTQDNAADMTRWVVGDSIGGSGIWGRPVRFAGLQYARNFTTQPGFVTQPLPAIVGQAELPSTVEVYLNSLLVSRQEVQPGPFQINGISTFGAGGTIQLVVRDLLGREVVTNLPFVTGASLLRQGLSDFSLEAGTLREQYGSAGFDYGGSFATATGRYGVTDSFTIEGRSETQPRQYTEGVGGSIVLPWLKYVLTTAVAESRSGLGSGDQETISFQPGAPVPIGISASLQTTSARFVQLGSASGPPPRYTGVVSLSLPMIHKLAFTVSQVRNAPRDRPGTVVDSLAINRSFGHRASVSFSAFTMKAATRNEGIVLTFSVGLRGDNSIVSSSNLQRSQGSPWSGQFETEFDHLPTSELGWSWDARATHDNSATPSGENQVGAGAVYQGKEFSSSVQLDGNTEISQYQVDISGAVTMLGGHIYATRKIFDSFAIARAPDLPNLPVYVENQLAGYTDVQGNVLLPRLIEFADNKISINANDLPFDAELLGGDSMTIAPYSRTGVIAELPVRRFRSALVTLIQADGSPVPAGALVTYKGSGPDVYVADRGEAYLRDVVAQDNELHVQWQDGHACDVRFDLPPMSRLQQRIGPLKCLEQRP
jgi:outer membrane usher protein